MNWFFVFSLSCLLGFEVYYYSYVSYQRRLEREKHEKGFKNVRVCLELGKGKIELRRSDLYFIEGKYYKLMGIDLHTHLLSKCIILFIL